MGVGLGGGGRDGASFLFFEVGASSLIVIGMNVFTVFFPFQFFYCFLVKTEECAWSGRKALIEKSVYTPSFILYLRLSNK